MFSTVTSTLALRHLSTTSGSQLTNAGGVGVVFVLGVIVGAVPYVAVVSAGAAVSVPCVPAVEPGASGYSLIFRRIFSL